jgi:hypothetical protein
VWGLPTIVFYADQPNTLGCTYEAAFQLNFPCKLQWLVWFCIGLAAPCCIALALSETVLVLSETVLLLVLEISL